VTSRLLNVLEHSTFLRFMSEDVESRVQPLLHALYVEMGHMLQRTPWLDQATRTHALNKWRLMRVDVSFEQTWWNEEVGLALVGDWPLDFVATSSYAMQLQLLSVDVPGDLRTLRTTDMYDSPFKQSSYYAPDRNLVSLLPGELLFPTFDRRHPLLLNVAGLGWAIGHEMTHAFDTTGRYFDALGESVDWWMPATAARYAQRAQCFVEQYENITSASMLGVRINGTQTLGENIADNGGIGLAWRVYQAMTSTLDPPLLPDTNITNDQLFWVMQIEHMLA